MADEVEAGVRQTAAQLRAGILGRIARQCPIAAPSHWSHALNADFEDGSRPWQGDIYIVDHGRIGYVQTWPEPYARMREHSTGTWSALEPHLDVGRNHIGFPRPEPGQLPTEWLPPPPITAPKPGTAPTDWACLAIERIPQTIRRGLAPFRFGQWRLLCLSHNHGAAVDLLGANPALAWAMASAPIFFDRPPRDLQERIAAVLARRQREIAGWLGFPPIESAARLLRKVRPEACGAAPLLALRRLMSDPTAIESLRHLHELPASLLLVAASHVLRPLLSPALIDRIAQQLSARPEAADPAAGDIARAPTIAHLLEDVSRMYQMIPTPPAMRRIETVEALSRFHDELVEQFLAASRPTPRAEARPADPDPEPRARRRPRRVLERPVAAPQIPDAPPAPAPIRKTRRPPGQFPAPPFPGGSGIEPIVDAHSLAQEAAQQHNCVGSYAQRIRYGNYYVYRVATGLGRATLGLRRDWNGDWRIDQLAGPYNNKVSDDLRSEVVKWFHKCLRQWVEEGLKNPPHGC